MKPRIQAVDAAKKVGDRRHRTMVWEHINVSVHEGEMVALTGPSGCGKSTLLNCIGLLDRLDAGAVLLDGQNLSDASERARRRWRRSSIGYLFQDYALVENETVAQNIALAAPTRSARATTTAQALSRMGLEGRERDDVAQLSGGEQQRAAMARLLVRNPKIVLADEPTASLDRTNAKVILDELSHMAHQGAAVMIVSHDPWVVDQCTRREELFHA